MLGRVTILGKIDEQETLVNTLQKAGDVEVIVQPETDQIPAGTGMILPGSIAVDALSRITWQQLSWQEQLLLLLGTAIEAREQHIPGAVERLVQHAERFAKALGLDPEQRSTLERGSLVHDIGKLQVSSEVLLKKTVLTYDEWTLLQRHTHLGGDILKTIEPLQDTEVIARTHHECFDGTGYPEGLEGEEIPLLGRIMKILDVYCAMTSPRHYRQGKSSHEDALEFLQKEKGNHFDPELVQVFIDSNVGEPMEDDT